LFLVRIASLVPSATEMLFALGLGDRVVGVTHECDHPIEAAALPHLTRTVIPPGLSAAEIDRAVRERTERGEALYELDHERLRELDPELIVTQAVCEVCAVSFDDVRAIAERLPSKPRVVSLDPTTLGEVLRGLSELGEAAGAQRAAEALLGALADRIDGVRAAVEDAPRPRVAALEWLDPVFAGGHWVPQMVEIAGGEDPLGLPGERSRTAEWAEVEAARPDVVAVIPCGYDAERSAEEASMHAGELARLGAGRVIAFDAAAYFSRPGPRLVDGIELLAHVLHPDGVAQPPPRRLVEVDLGASAGARG
jgi:iron complex transport system substrate-binding protein